MRVQQRSIIVLFVLFLSSCEFPRAAEDYLHKLEQLANKIEQLARQERICMSAITKLEQRYDYLAPGKNSSLEFDFTDQEAERFEQLNRRIEQANRKIVQKGNADC